MRCAFAVVPLLLVAACTDGVESDSTTSRSSLTYAELHNVNAQLAGPVANDLFLPADDAGEALHDFSASIVIPERPMQTSPAVLEPREIAGGQTQLFPGLQVGFISRGDRLVPVRRDIIVIPDSASFWQIQVAPGRVWSEPGDRGMSRASFPFMLTSIIENESYNGIATFLYDDDDVSAMRYQIVQQTSPYFMKSFFTAWDQLPLRLATTRFDNADAVLSAFEQELRDRWPVHDWQELIDRYGAEALQGFDSGVEPEKIATSGLVIDGEIFVKATDTPYGPYAYPLEMRHGIWSITKSAAGMVTLLRMAQKYGDEIYALQIRDLLDVTAEHDGWDEVTIADTANMATGIGTGSEQVNSNYISDGYITSDQEAYDAWYLAPSNLEKQQYLFRVASHPWGPGEHVRYRDRDIYVLAAALDVLYKKKEGPDADLWQMMLDEVYGPLGIHHMPQNRSIESDGKPGVPFLAWGQYLTVDDAAKIGTLLQNGGRHDGEQLLSPTKLAEALYQTDVQGLPTGETNQYGDKSYHMTLWHSPYRTLSGEMTSVGEMHGWGGNVISLIPNGIVGFRFGNGGYRPLEGVIPVADRIRPFDAN